MKFGQRGLDAYKAQNTSRKQDKGKENSNNSALKALIMEDQKEKLVDHKLHKPGLLKTGRVQSEELNGQNETDLTGIKKAARFLLLLGKDEAGTVLRNMSEQEIEQITAEIARIESVSPDEARLILDDFGYSIQPHTVRGGVGMARDILSRAFGEEKSSQYINKVVPDSLPAPFSFMNDLSLPQLLQILDEEPVESLALVLSFLDAGKVSSFIKTQAPEKQVMLVKRMARLQKLHPDVIVQMEGLLQERVHNIARKDDVEIDGPARLTEILKHMNPQEEKMILRNLEEQNPDLSHRIQDELLTMDCLFNLRPRDLQNLLLETANETLVLLLKDKDDRIIEQILSHLSSQRRMLLEEERIVAPLVPRKEVQDITKEFLEKIRRKQEEGSYILLSEEDEYLI